MTDLIERLRKCAASHGWTGDPPPESVAALHLEAAAALEAAREDAERYRWLRRKVSAHGVIDGWTFAFPTHLTLPAPASAMRDPAGGLDAAIDQARGKGGA